MRGGFTFTLSTDKRLPAVRIKHLSRRDMRDLVEFLAGLKEAKK